MLEWFFSQSGQVGEEGSTEGDSTPAPTDGGAVLPADDTPDFVKPIEGLKPELAGEWEKHRKGMQSSYTKALNKLKERETQLGELSGKYSNIDRFYTDNSFAKETVSNWAKQNGFQLLPAQQAQQAAASQTPVPPAILQRVEASLPQELKWMAPHLAAAQWSSLSPILAASQQAMQQQTQKQRSEAIETTLSELSDSDPGWEEHEEEMVQLLDYLQSPELNHKVFGSKPKLLLSLLKGNTSAIKEATNRMRNAVKHKATTPSPGSGQSNLTDRVRKAGTDREAWDLLRKNLAESGS